MLIGKIGVEKIMMKAWQNKQFKRWEITRKKGQLSYVFKNTLIIGGGILLGDFLGFIIFDKVRTWEEYSSYLYVQTSLVLVLGLIMNYFLWIIGDVIYEKELKKRKFDKLDD